MYRLEKIRSKVDKHNRTNEWLDIDEVMTHACPRLLMKYILQYRSTKICDGPLASWVTVCMGKFSHLWSYCRKPGCPETMCITLEDSHTVCSSYPRGHNNWSCHCCNSRTWGKRGLITFHTNLGAGENRTLGKLLFIYWHCDLHLARLLIIILDTQALEKGILPTLLAVCRYRFHYCCCWHLPCVMVAFEKA